MSRGRTGARAKSKSQGIKPPWQIRPTFERLEQRLVLDGLLLSEIPAASATVGSEFQFDVSGHFADPSHLNFSSSQNQIQLAELASGFQSPVQIVSADDGSGRVFVVEQTGAVRILRHGNPGPDTIAPTVSNVFPSTTDSDAIIGWSSDEPTTGHVEFGTTASLGNVSEVSALGEYHRSLLPGLDPDTEYFFKVVATDGAGNTTDSPLFSFVTEPVPVDGEVLYNGIVLPQQWPPPSTPNQIPQVAPYLVSPPPAINIDVGRQLFVDDFLIEETDLHRTPHRPQFFDANPVLAAGDEYDFNHFAMPNSDGVWYDSEDGLFKMWYMGSAGNLVSYAYSTDGLNWIKPELPNSVIANTNTVVQIGGGRASTTVWMDPLADDPNRKFQLFAFKPPQKMDVWYSADGIDWTKDSLTIPALVDRSTMFYNPFREVWVSSLRSEATLLAAGDRDRYPARIRLYAESPDLANFPAPRFWTGPDTLDRRYYEPFGEYPELYNLDAVAYESVLVGLFSWWHPGVPYPSYDETGPRVNELGVGFSRDGFHWERPTRGSGDQAFIPASKDPNAWNGYNTQSAGGGFLVVGDELWFYFSGRSEKKPFFGDTSTGLAKLRRDGFYSMDADGAGTLTTRPVQFSGQYLFVNVDNPSGQLQVEILDADGNVIAPFSKANSSIVSTDSTLTEVTWSGGGDLSSLAGTPVRFRFHLSGGSLYSFWVSDSANGASNGYVAAGGPGLTGPTDTVGNTGYTPSADATHAGNERILAPTPSSPGYVQSQPFLDLSGNVDRGFGKGLQSIAFHPQFDEAGAAGEGKLYVLYSAPPTLDDGHDTVLAEFTVSTSDPDVVDPGSQRELLRLSQPDAVTEGGLGADGIELNDSDAGRKGGGMRFGPDDGLLYLSTGSSVFSDAADLDSLLGKVLRIDVDGTNSANGQYGIPAGNPFVGVTDARDEIFAYGFHHPRHLFFDDGVDGAASPDRLFVTDVGDSLVEEVNLVVGGSNYGWAFREGMQTASAGTPGPLVDPIAVYAKTGFGEGIIGGNVYRGSGVPIWDGRFLMGDTIGQLRTLSDNTNGWELQTNLAIDEVLLSVGSIADDIYLSTPNTVYQAGVQAAGLPDWLSFDSQTGVFSGTPEVSDLGTISIEVTASEQVGGSDSSTFDLTVSQQQLPLVSVIATDGLASEPSDDAELTFSRFGDVSAPLNVQFSVSGDATPGNDFASLGTSVTIPTGQYSVSLPVSVIDDAEVELDETLVVTIDDDDAYHVTRSSTAVAAVISDEQFPFVDVIVSDGNVAEPSENGSLTITRTGDNTDPLTVYFAVGGTATADVDYASIGTSVVIPGGSSSVDILVNVNDDSEYEGAESIEVTLAADPVYALGAAVSATVLIAENELPAFPVTGLVGHWSLDETSGTVAADVSGNNHHGVVIGSANWTDGRIAGGLQLDGVNNGVDVGTGPAIVGTGGFTVAAWIRTTSAGNQVIVQQRSPEGFNGEYVLQLNPAGNVYFWTFGGSKLGPTVTSSQPLNDGNWHHITAVREEDGTMVMYVDGVFDRSTSGDPRPLIPIGVYLGLDGRDNNKHFAGSLDDVRIYDRALAAEDAGILALSAPQSGGSISAVDDTYSANEDAVLNVTAPGILLNDQGSNLTVSSADSNSQLGLPIASGSDGSFAYNPLGQFEQLSQGQSVTDTFSYTISDGSLSDSATVSITIHGRNDAPTAANDVGTTNEDASVSLSVLLNDSDIDQLDTITIDSINDAGTIGTVTPNPDGTIQYDPNGQFDHLDVGETATDVFSYTIADNFGATATAEVQVTISGLAAPQGLAAGLVAHWPLDEVDGTIAADTSGGGHDGEVGGDPIWTRGNLDGGLTFDGTGDNIDVGLGPSIVGEGGFAVAAWVRTATRKNQVIIQQRAAEINGEYMFHLLRSGQVRFWTFGGNRYGPVVLTSERVNDGLWHHVVGVREDDGTTKVYVDGTLAASKAGAPRPLIPINVFIGADMRSRSQHFAGTIDEVRIYDRALDAVEVQQLFEYRPHFGIGTDDHYQIDEEDSLAVSAPGVLANDTGVNLSVVEFDSISASGVPIDSGSDGSFQYAIADQFQYLAAGEDFTDTFTYTVFDGTLADDATVSVTVAGVNDQPIADDESVLTDEGAQININVLLNDFDVDASDTLVIDGLHLWNTTGIVAVQPDGMISYDPSGEFESLAVDEIVVESFVYTISDGNGGRAQATTTITINGLNDPPYAAADYAAIDEETATVIAVLANDIDIDASDTLTVTSVDDSATVGNVAIQGNSIAYDPTGSFDDLVQGETALDSFSYTVSDGNGGSATATVHVSIAGLGLELAAVDDSEQTTESSAVILDVLANDLDGGSPYGLTIQSVDTTSTLGSVQKHGSSLTYDPVGQFEHLNAGQTATDSFGYTVEDGNGGTDTAIVTITIEGADESPVPTTGLVAHWPLDDSTGEVASDQSGNAHHGAVDGDPVWSSGPVGGALTLDGSGDYVDVGLGPSIVGTGGFTVSTRFRTGAAYHQVIIQQRSQADFNGEYMLHIDSGRVRFWTFGGLRYGPIVSSLQSVDDNQWHHVAAVREDDGTTKIYVDGVLDNSRSGTPRPLIPINVYVGGDLRANSSFFSGSLDDVRIYDRALDAGEVAQLAAIGGGAESGYLLGRPSAAAYPIIDRERGHAIVPRMEGLAVRATPASTGNQVDRFAVKTSLPSAHASEAFDDNEFLKALEEKIQVLSDG